MNIRTHAANRLSSAVALVLLLVLAPATVADDTTPRPADARVPPAAPVATPPPRCVPGCERWGRVCNVDPRGVYKCQRRCERFGEICE